MASGGVKKDTGKAPWSLLPFDALRQVVIVLAAGARKYAARNWEKGVLWSRYYDAAMRHQTAWWQESERDDPEDGLHHLAHAICCLLFLLAYDLRGMGKKRVKDPATDHVTKMDDRPGPQPGLQP